LPVHACAPSYFYNRFVIPRHFFPRFIVILVFIIYYCVVVIICFAQVHRQLF